MSDFNAAQALAEAYTLYKKHHGGMGLDFKIAIAQVREESEQRGAIKALREAATRLRDSKFANSVKPPHEKVQVPESDWLERQADLLEGDDD